MLEFEQAGNDEYEPAEPVYLRFQVVNKPRQTQQISYTPPAALTYGDAPLPLGMLATSGLPLTYQVTGPVEIHYDSLYILGAGHVSLLVRQAGNAEYEPAVLALDFVIRKAEQAITLDLVPVNDTTYQILTTASSGLPVAVRLLKGDAEISGQWLYATQSGTVVLEASQPGHDNYLPAKPVQRTQEVQVVLGVSDKELMAIQYYPNPVIRTVTLTRHAGAVEAQIHLVDVIGKVLLAQPWKGVDLSLDLSTLAEGTYLLYYQPSSGVAQSMRLIKK